MIRVGHIAAGWTPGGQTRGILNALSAPSSVIRWIGAAIPSLDRFYPITNGLKVLCHQRGEHRHLVKTDSFLDSVQSIIDNSDVIFLQPINRPENREILTKADWSGKPVVLSSHGSARNNDIIVKNLPFATHYRAVSQAAAFAFPEHLRHRVHITYNGLDPARMEPTCSRYQMRANWKMGPYEKVIGFAGRMVTSKNPMATAILANEVGFIPVFCGELNPTLCGVLSTICPRSRFIPQMEQIGNFWQAVDLFVLASDSEGHCQALTEAWYAGVPAISTLVGAVPEFEAVYGPLTSHIPVNPTADYLVGAIERIQPLTVGRAKQVARSRFTNDQHVRDLENLVRFVAG